MLNLLIVVIESNNVRRSFPTFQNACDCIEVDHLYQLSTCTSSVSTLTTSFFQNSNIPVSQKFHIYIDQIIY